MGDLPNFVQAKCKGMCPEQEIKLRIRERLVHTLELEPGGNRPDRTKMVKSFSRSAAGKLTQNPENIRPPEVLIKTVNYLLDDVLTMHHQPLRFRYDFIMDRLRSVRQDMIIQNASKASCICILQPIIKFYAYSAYRLCNETIHNFDPHINQTHLQECLKRLLCVYDEYDRIFSSDDFNEYLDKCRSEIEALYIVLNLGNTAALTRAINLPEKWKRKELVHVALNLSLSYYRGNYVRVCRIMQGLPPLLAAVSSLHLPGLRRKAIERMSIAYNSKNLLFPLGPMEKLFLYDAIAEVISECEYYGLEVRDKKISFQKSAFKTEKISMPMKRYDFVERKLCNVDVRSLIMYD